METFSTLVQSPEYFQILIFFVLSTFFCFIFLLCFLKFWTAFAQSLEPNLNLHKSPPSGAGLVFSCVYLLTGLILDVAGYSFLERPDLFFYLTPLFLMSVAGFLDDIFEFPWLPRLVFYFLTSVCFVVFTQPTGLLTEPELKKFDMVILSLSIVVLLWMTNIYNFMDGIDGLAASEAIFVLLSVSLMCLFFSESTPSPFLFFLIGPLISFLLLNLPKAKIFMGDSGSIFLGFFFGVALLHEIDVSVWCWLTLLGMFLADGTSTAMVRFFRRQNLAKKHQSHFYQHLSKRCGVWRALILIQCCNVFWLFPMALLCFLNPQYGSQIFIVSMFPLLAIHFYFGAGRTEPHFFRE